MAGKGIGGHHRSALAQMRHYSDEWLTPKWIVDALGPFDLDPCTPKTMPWSTAARRYTKADDGLSRSWGGVVWLNPPYGRATAVWLERLAEHGNGIALIFARTETVMFHRYVFGAASAVLFLRGRLDFLRPDGLKPAVSPSRRNTNAGGPSCLVAYGLECESRLRDSAIPGFFVALSHQDCPFSIGTGVCRDHEVKAI